MNSVLGAATPLNVYPKNRMKLSLPISTQHAIQLTHVRPSKVPVDLRFVLKMYRIETDALSSLFKIEQR